MLISPGDIPALGREARHAKPEPGGVLCTDEERQRTQVLFRRARGCETHHAELKSACSESRVHYILHLVTAIFLVDGFKLLRN